MWLEVWLELCLRHYAARPSQTHSRPLNQLRRLEPLHQHRIWTLQGCIFSSVGDSSGIRPCTRHYSLQRGRTNCCLIWPAHPSFCRLKPPKGFSQNISSTTFRLAVRALRVRSVSPRRPLTTTRITMATNSGRGNTSTPWTRSCPQFQLTLPSWGQRGPERGHQLPAPCPRRCEEGPYDRHSLGLYRRPCLWCGCRNFVCCRRPPQSEVGEGV